MTWVLFVVYVSHAFVKGFSISEFKSKAACEVALKEAKLFMGIIDRDSKCIEVRGP